MSNIWVLSDHDKIIGFVSIQPYLSINRAWVKYLFVDPQYHRQGYGSKLTEALFEYGYKQMGYKSISGSTSSLQTSQIKMQENYINMAKQKGYEIDLKIDTVKKYWWLPIYEIRFNYIGK